MSRGLFLSPVIARWNVVDPLADATISLSPYHYAANNPVAYKNLLGLTPHYNYSNGNYYEDDGTEVSWSYVQASISMSDGISAAYKPLTRTRLIQLGEQIGYGVAGTGKFNADVGNAFEAVAAKFWGFTGPKRSFASDARRAMTNGKKNSVEPDSWGLVTIHKWDSDHGLLSYLVGTSELGNFVDVI